MKARYDTGQEFGPDNPETLLRHPQQQKGELLNETLSALTEQSHLKSIPDNNKEQTNKETTKYQAKLTKNGSDKSLPVEKEHGLGERQTSLLDQCLLGEPQGLLKSEINNNQNVIKNSGRSQQHSKWGTSRNQNAIFSQNSQLMSKNQVLRSPSSSRQPVVISMNCSRAISTHNYTQLEKLVKNHMKERQAKEGQQAANSFQEKQKALEQRIEKLRKIENQVRYWDVCSKKNCPPNDELAPKDFMKLVTEFKLENQIKSSQNSKFHGGPRLLNGSGLLAQKLTSTLLAAGHGKKEKTKVIDLDGLQEGTYFFNSDDSDQEDAIKQLSKPASQKTQTNKYRAVQASKSPSSQIPVKVNTNAMSFNFMRKHQVQKVTHDIPLSVLLQQKRDKARKKVQLAKQEEMNAESAMQRRPSPLNVVRRNNELVNSEQKTNTLLSTPQKGAAPSRNCATMLNSNAQSYDRNPFKNSQPRQSEEHSAYFNMKKDYESVLEPESPILTSHFRSITPQPAGYKRQSVTSQGVRAHKKYTFASHQNAYDCTPEKQAKNSEKIGQENPQLRASNSLWKLASQAHNQEFKGLLTEEREEETSNEIEKQLRQMILNQRAQQSKDEMKKNSFVVDPQMIKIMYQYVQQTQQKRQMTSQLQHQGLRRGLTSQFGRQNTIKRNNLSQLGSYSTTTQNQVTSFISKTPQNSAFQPKMSMKTRQDILKSSKQMRHLSSSEQQDPISNPLFKEVSPILQNNLEKIKNILRQVELTQNDKDLDQLAHETNMQQIAPLDLTQLDRQASNQKSFPNFSGLDNNQIAKQVEQIRQIDKNVKESPQKDSKTHLASKQEIEDTVMQQFKKRKASDHYQNRAVENYMKQKQQNGIKAEDVQKPDKMLHFHIDAFEDNIQMNLYQEEEAFEDDRMKEVQIKAFEEQSHSKFSERRLTQKSQKSNSRPPSINIPRSNTSIMPTLNLFGKNMQKKEKSTSYNSERRMSEDSLETDTEDSVAQSVNGLYVKKDPDIKDFANFATSLGGIDSYLLQSPELRTKKRARESSIKSKFVFKSPNSGDKMAQSQQIAQQRTLLMSKEISDFTEYFSNLELQILSHFSEKQAKEAFKVLVKASRPIFSGSVDFRINLLDSKKVNQLSCLKNIQQKVGQSYHLLEESKEMNDQLQNRQMLHGIWDQFTEVKGFYPEGRKNSTINLISNQIYLFGGNSRDTFNDLRKFDLYDKRWTLVQPKSQSVPQARSNHSMCNYGAKLVLFAGCGAYMKNLKIRPSLNDLWTFDTVLEKWHKIEGSGIRPKKRRGHTAAILGSLMLVHGGQNTESRTLMDDFNLFDFEACHWFKTKVYMGANEVEAVNQYGTTIDSDIEQGERMKSIGLRMNHCLVSIYERTSPQPSTSKDSKEKLLRQMWIKEREWTKLEIKQGKQYEQGFYLFGGVDNNNQTQNDLWLIKPHYEMNKKAIDYTTFGYQSRDPELVLKIKQITDYKGRKPCPRFQASMIHINLRQSGKQLLVVYGGRNDSVFEHTGNLALNDICIFNVNQKTWEPLAIFGQMPTSRWAHCLVPVPNQASNEEGFIMFGGINTQTYCRSKLYSFTFPDMKGVRGGNFAAIFDRRNSLTDKKGLSDDDLPDFIRKQTTLIDKDMDYNPQKVSQNTNGTTVQGLGLGVQLSLKSKGTEINSSSGTLGRKFTQLQEAIKDRIEILREVVQREQKIAEKKKENKQN